MVPISCYIIVALGAYLAGSIPFGFLVARAKGIDIRSVGSGNIGATNALRVLGKPAGIFVLLMDMLKGYLACAFVPALIYNCLFAPSWADVLQNQPVEIQMRLKVLAGIFAVLGHNYPCWLKFKGGKGIATSAGVVLAWAPMACVVALAVWGVAVAATRYVSVASIAAAIVLPIAVWFTKQSVPMTLVMTALSVLAIYKHRGNVQRLREGTENRLGAKRANAQDESRA